MEFVASPYESLRYSLRNCRDQLPDSLSTRLHRAISWLNCAEQQYEDADVRFISLWVGLNACICVEQSESMESLGEKESFSSFVSKLIQHDSQKQVYACLWQTYSGPVKGLIKNPYVYHGFWQAQRNKQSGKDAQWEDEFNQSSVASLNYLSRQQVPELLGIVLDRLWVLHQQIMLGGATYQSSVNRDQVKEGGKLLSSLLPIIVDIMMSSPHEDWGRISYPVVTE